MARRWMVLFSVVAVFAGVWSAASWGATQAEIDAAIEAGSDWVGGQQAASGAWGYYGEVAPTGLAGLELEEYG